MTGDDSSTTEAAAAVSGSGTAGASARVSWSLSSAAGGDAGRLSSVAAGCSGAAASGAAGAGGGNPGGGGEPPPAWALSADSCGSEASGWALSGLLERLCSSCSADGCSPRTATSKWSRRSAARTSSGLGRDPDSGPLSGSGFRTASARTVARAAAAASCAAIAALLCCANACDID